MTRVSLETFRKILLIFAGVGRKGSVNVSMYECLCTDEQGSCAGYCLDPPNRAYFDLQIVSCTQFVSNYVQAYTRY